MVRLIEDFDLLGADCERLEKEAADKVAIGVARATAQKASVPSVIPATGVSEAMMVDVHSSSIHRDGGAANTPPRIQELEGKMVVGREEAAGLTSCHG